MQVFLVTQGAMPIALIELRLREILVPNDFTECSLKALSYALSFAKLFQANVLPMHVVESVPVMTQDAMLESTMLNVAEHQESEKRLRRWRREAMSDTPIKTMTCEGVAWQKIVEVAKENGTDLIVAGTGRQSALARMVLGSTAERIVRHAPCPVLVVRERERDFLNAVGCHGINHFSHHNRKAFDLIFVRRASQNDVGPSGLGRHEKFVHRGYRLSKLPMNGAHIAAPCGSVSLYAAVKAEPGRTIKKDAKIEHAANFRPPQKPKAVHQDNWFGRQYSGLTRARVSDKVVFWRPHLAAQSASLQHRLGCRPINGARMIVIYPVSTGWRQMRLVAIKIVQGHTGQGKLQGFLQPLRKPALAGATSPHDGYQFGPNSLKNANV